MGIGTWIEAIGQREGYNNKLLGKSPSEYRQNEISSFFERLRSVADVDMATPEYAEAIGHMTHCANICFKINTTAPTPEHLRPLLPLYY